MNEYVGNIHVHTTYSDGTADFDEVAGAAKSAGLDFVLTSDHNTLAPLREGREHYYGGVLVLVGTEVGKDNNHYLAWRVSDEIPDDPDNPQSIIDGVNAQGGIGFIAHPHEKGCKYGYSGKAFTWDDWDVEGFTGVCIWNFTSQWKGSVTDPFSALYYFLFRRGAVRSPEPETMAKFDELLAARKVVAIGGTDAHGFRFGWWPFKPRIFPYKYLFRTINTHILTDDALTGDLAHDRDIVYGALEEGRCFVGYDLLGDTRGFEFYAMSGGSVALMGGELELAGSVKFVVKLPGRVSYIKVFRDGKPWREEMSTFSIFTANQPGVYRVEVSRQGISGNLRTWIVSNPIYVRER
jgi:hypothetical protein